MPRLIRVETGTGNIVAESVQACTWSWSCESMVVGRAGLLEIFFHVQLFVFWVVGYCVCFPLGIGWYAFLARYDAYSAPCRPWFDRIIYFQLRVVSFSGVYFKRLARQAHYIESDT